MAYTTIDNPGLYFNTVVYAGSNSDQSITGVGFQPDWVWIKNRSSTPSHMLNDVVRGAGKQMNSDNNNAELDRTYFISFDSDGFTLDGNVSDYNQNSSNFVSWNWKAGGSTSSNGNGSITSTVSHNSTSGFSIGTYTGNGTAGATVGHGLGATPDVLIVKERGNTNSWIFSHKNLTDQSGYYLLLNSDDAQATDDFFNNTSPTSTVFSTNSTPTNRSSGTYVFYAFKEVKGYSKFGSYKGNGNADGTFIYTGFKPAFFMIKRITGAGYGWFLYDNKRQFSFNVIDDFLYPNANDAETTGNANQSLDFLSNGVKHRGNGQSSNSNGVEFIYMAFAETPFVTAGTKAAGTAR